MAGVINSDIAELKYSLLKLESSDFHFHDHRAIFNAMKKLDAEGYHVDQITVRDKIGDKWPDTLKAVFDESNVDAGAVETYKHKVIRWSNINTFRRILHEHLARVEATANDTKAYLPELVASLFQSIFDDDKKNHLSVAVPSEADLIDNFLLDLASPNLGYGTGFKNLDRLIMGLTQGLFVIAAAPSAGKTTLVWQIANEVARLNETPVIFFSYEQSAVELRIKSLARLSKKIGLPVSNELIKEGFEAEKVEQAAEKYKTFAGRIKIIEGDRRNSIGDIRLKTQYEKMKTGKSPLVVIDYMQIIPFDSSSRMDKRHEIDLLVSDLRRIARDLEVPIIAVSSMARDKYGKAVLAGFKETGGIEYGTDIAAVLTVEDETDEGKERNVKLSIIKNRNGRRGKISFKYHTEYDYFEEMSDFEYIKYTEGIE